MLKIKFVNAIPQWIIESDIAAYHQFSNTIYVRKDKWWKIFHELGHWIGHKLGGKEHWIHKLLDRRLNEKYRIDLLS